MRSPSKTRSSGALLETTKVDADYPDHKLSGAVFEIYADVDNNGKFDADVDRLVGEMAETEPGLYQLKDLACGNYLLHEKEGPEFFEKDDAYHPFSIVENGRRHAGLKPKPALVPQQGADRLPESE